MLVGRDVELARLERLLETVRGGSGRAVVVAGEAGVGKTRLVREFATRAGAAELTVAVGRAAPDRAPVPMRALLEACLSLTRSAVLPDAAELGPYAAVLGRLVPEWSMSGTTHEAVPAPLLGEGVLRLVPLVAPGGCVLVIEDVHWADPETLAVLEYLGDYVRSAAVGLVLTIRDAQGADAWSVVDGLVRRDSAELVGLEPLPPADVAAMVRACGVPERAGLAEVAGGLPLLVEELLGERAGVPRGFVDSIERRVADLGAAASGVVLAASVLGQRFDWRLVAAAVELPAEVIGDVLTGAVRAGLMVADGEAYQFRHALTRDAVLDGAPAPRTAALAKRCLAALRARHPELPGELAALAAGLAERADDDAAPDLFRLAGSRAAAEGSLDSVAALFDRAVATARDGPARIAAMDAIAEVHCRAGRLDEAIAAAGQVGLLLREHPDDHVRRRLHVRLARSLAEAARWEAAEDELRPVTVDGRRGRSEPTEAENAEIAVVEAMILLGRHRRVEAARRAREVVEAALRAGRPDLACEASEVVGRAERNHDQGAALAAFERAHAVAVRRALPLAAVSALHELGTIDMFDSGRRDRLLAARAGAEAAGAVRLVAVLDLQLTAAHHMHGDARLAEACAERALEGATTLGIEPMRVMAWALRTCPAGLTGDRAAVEAAIAAIPPGTLDPDPDAQASLWGPRGRPARCCGRTGSPPSSRSRPRPGSSRALPRCTRRPGGGSGCCCAPSTAARPRGRSRRCGAGRRRATARTSPTPSWPRPSWPGGPATGRPQRPPSSGGTRVGSRWAWLRHLGRRLVAEAALADGWGEPVLARRWLTEAADFFDGFGAPAVSAACHELLGGSRPPTRPWRPEGVTAREAEVLALLGDGVTGTREVAARLGISPRTVEKHVEALCRKLAVRTRSQLAALAARHGVDQTRATT